MKSILGAIPYEFTEYWISKFPRLLSHSYHALEPCSKENSFLLYYPKSYVFTMSGYFHSENTDDFVPSEQPKLMRDTSKKYNKDSRNKYHGERRPSPHDLENVGSSPLYRNVGRPLHGIDNFNKTTNKKGSYNFHRNTDNVIYTQQLSPNQQQTLKRSASPIQRSASPISQPTPPQPESKYVEDADGFVLVKPKHNTANVRHRKSDATKTTTPNDDANFVWTLPK